MHTPDTNSHSKRAAMPRFDVPGKACGTMDGSGPDRKIGAFLIQVTHISLNTGPRAAILLH